MVLGVLAAAGIAAMGFGGRHAPAGWQRLTRRS
jgi:hypothetical protein